MVIPKYRTSPQAAPDGFDGPEKVVTMPVLEASSPLVGSLFIVGGALSRSPASSSKIKGDQIIIAALPAKYSSLDCFQNNSPGGEAFTIDL